ncbi:MAG: STN domain-containing protein [Candidatus Sumerlaeia bacterium]|nr:STN domain-containing protein [Candidatus Sumerlaeia bacterium]
MSRQRLNRMAVVLAGLALASGCATKSAEPVESSAVAVPAGPRVTAMFKDARVEMVVASLTAQTGARIQMGQGVVGKRVSLMAQEMPLELALATMAESAGLTVTPRGEGVYLLTGAGVATPAEGTPVPESEESARERRIRQHEERIRQIIEENRERQRQEAEATQP